MWFPDLPGCFSAGDDLDKALRNAPEAIALYAESLAEEGLALPRPPRTLTELKRDPEVARDIADYMVARARARRCDRGVSARPRSNYLVRAPFTALAHLHCGCQQREA